MLWHEMRRAFLFVYDFMHYNTFLGNIFGTAKEGKEMRLLYDR
jgi:hypothetical protein